MRSAHHHVTVSSPASVWEFLSHNQIMGLMAPSSADQVSLLEYRKRKQGNTRDSESICGSSSVGGTPTRHGSQYTQDFHYPLPHQQIQHPAYPHGSYSSSAHIPQIEEVSPPDHQGSGVSRQQDNQWWDAATCHMTLSADKTRVAAKLYVFYYFSRMVPTTVERLREGQGVRERLLRGIKMERSYRRSHGSTEKESGKMKCHTEKVTAKSFHRKFGFSVTSHLNHLP